MRGAREIAFFVPAVGVFVADQLTKAWVRHSIPVNTFEPFLGPIRLTHVDNAGGVFGITASPVFLSLLTAIDLIILLLFYRRLSSLLMRTSLGLILGGGLGNLVDRLRLHHVTDFMDVRVWPIFNVADASVVVGALIILYLLIRGKA
jgi:signal peptidase II